MENCARFGVLKCQSYNRFINKRASKNDVLHLTTVLHDNEILHNGVLTTFTWDNRMEYEIVSCIIYFIALRPRELDSITYDKLNFYTKVALAKALVMLLEKLKLSDINAERISTNQIMLSIKHKNITQKFSQHSYTEYCIYSKDRIVKAVLNLIEIYKM